MLWKVEKARDRDVRGVKAVESGSGLSPWTEEDYRSEAQREDSIFLVVIDDVNGEPFGFIIVRLITISESSRPSSRVPFEAEVLNLGVHPAFRRQGIGKALLVEALDQLRNLGSGAVHLEVRARNGSAIAFYRRFGFEVTGRRPGFYKEPVDDAVLMSLRI